MSKVILVSQTLRGGGAERVVSILSQEFVKRGYKVKIALFSKEVEYEYGGEIIDIDIGASKSYIKKILALFNRVKKLKKVFEIEKPDYVFSFMEGCNFACILTGYDIVVSVRNNPEAKFKWYQKFLIRILYKFKNVKRVVAVSQNIENVLRDKYTIKNTKVIYNPVVFQDNRVVEKLDRFKPFILGIGRLHRQKNFEMLINAFSKLNFDKNLKLIILGDGNLRDKLNLLIKSRNMQGRIFLLGNVKNVSDYYKQCEIFVLSSIFEGFPNVLIEALSNGCACIATDCPTGPNEIIVNDTNGFLVKNNDEDEMAKAITKLYLNPSLKDRCKNNAIRSIGHLSVENIVNEWIAAYL